MSNPATAILSNAVKLPLPKIIGPTTHGVIDYAHCAFFFGVALFCRKSNKRASNAALATSAMLLAQAALTDYRFGIKPVLPFAVHGEMDSGFASLSWVIPRICGFSGTGASRIFEVNSMVEAAVVRMTDFDSERARRDREEHAISGIPSISSAV